MTPPDTPLDRARALIARMTPGASIAGTEGDARGYSFALRLARSALSEEGLEAMARAYEASLLGPFAAKIELNRNNAIERRCEAMRAALAALVEMGGEG